MKKKILLILVFIGIFSYSQDYSYKSKEYDLEIFKYLIEKSEKDSTSLDEFIKYSKPFSKWDIRPLNVKNVWAMDTIYTASTVPNFIWGSFSQKYNLTLAQASERPNQFLEEGLKSKFDNVKFLNENLTQFKNLTKKIIKSSNSIFLNQKDIQRVDEIYKENNTYWKYIIPEDSPFPLSNRTNFLPNYNFTKDQEEILKLLSQLNIYSVYKSENGIYFLIDGFTDNSYGFLYNSKGQIDKNNKLFEIMNYQELTDNYFYYVAN